jgi:hypothetical protein
MPDEDLAPGRASMVDPAPHHDDQRLLSVKKLNTCRAGRE